MKKRVEFEIHHGRFEPPSGVDLWSFAPPRSLSEAELEDELAVAYEHSSNGGLLILWLPARALHVSTWDIWDDSGPWRPVSSLVSGRGEHLKLGLLYGKGEPLDKRVWGYRHIEDAGSRSGPTSSMTVKWMLDCLFPRGGGLVCDPYASRTGVLPTYCRRRQIGYIGFIQSKNGYEELERVLAQVELPAVQNDLPWA